jgi:hypothetical protein
VSDPTDLRALAEQDENENRLLAEKKRLELEDLRWLMGHAQGRRFATRVLEQTGVYRSTFNHSGSLMAFNEGRRDIGLWLTGELMEASSDGYIKMLKEHIKRD